MLHDSCQIQASVSSGPKTEETQRDQYSDSRLRGQVGEFGCVPIPFEISKKKFVYNVHVINKLCDDFILGLDFFHQAGLAYNPENHELFWTDKDGAKWKTAKLQCPDKLTLEPTSNRVVTLNVVTRRGYRTADACEAVAVITSKDHVVQGGPALVRINRLGQTTMEIFNCTNHMMTIEANALVGIIEKLSNDDEVGELIVNEMTVNIQKQQLPPAKPLTAVKRQ